MRVVRLTKKPAILLGEAIFGIFLSGLCIATGHAWELIAATPVVILHSVATALQEGSR